MSHLLQTLSCVAVISPARPARPARVRALDISWLCGGGKKQLQHGSSGGDGIQRAGEVLFFLNKIHLNTGLCRITLKQSGCRFGFTMYCFTCMRLRWQSISTIDNRVSVRCVLNSCPGGLQRFRCVDWSKLQNVSLTSGFWSHYCTDTLTFNIAEVIVYTTTHFLQITDVYYLLDTIRLRFDSFTVSIRDAMKNDGQIMNAIDLTCVLIDRKNSFSVHSPFVVNVRSVQNAA